MDTSRCSSEKNVANQYAHISGCFAGSSNQSEAAACDGRLILSFFFLLFSDAVYTFVFFSFDWPNCSLSQAFQTEVFFVVVFYLCSFRFLFLPHTSVCHFHFQLCASPDFLSLITSHSFQVSLLPPRSFFSCFLCFVLICLPEQQKKGFDTAK